MNKVKRFLIGASAGLMLLGNSFGIAGAAQPWDVSGAYNIAFECTPACGGPYVHDATLTQTGTTVDGVGGYPAGGPHTYEWDITSGSVTGDTINLTSSYTMGAPGTTMNMTGTIAANGTMSGTWTDNFGGPRSGTWTTTSGDAETAVTVPTIHTPAENAIVTQAALVKVDWTDSTGTNAPFQYQYEAYPDASYATPLYTSGWLAASEIPTPGTAPGDYYLRVRAMNSNGAVSDWSNGASDPYKITVIANPINAFPVPAECDQTVAYNLIEGTAGSDVLNGTSGPDLIRAKGGSDAVDGKGGADCIDGGAGSDYLKGGAGADVILGGGESDSILGENGADKLYGEGGSDALNGGDDADMLWGGAGSDSLQGNGGNDTLDGQAGSDAANGGAGAADTCTAEAETNCEL